MGHERCFQFGKGAQGGKRHRTPCIVVTAESTLGKMYKPGVAPGHRTTGLVLSSLHVSLSLRILKGTVVPSFDIQSLLQQ